MNHLYRPIALFAALFALFFGAYGCGSTDRKDDEFFTSGNREADQRAEQRIAKDQQNKGDGEGRGGSAAAQKAQEEKKSLYERLGSEKGLQAIVDDFVARAMNDPRVNWERKGVKRGGYNPLKRKESVEWQASEEKVANLKKHMVQFLSVATGGPTSYEGKEMKQAHGGLNITNTEFDASVGDLKASLDKVGVPVAEQKELLAIVESTRAQVTEERD